MSTFASVVQSLASFTEPWKDAYAESTALGVAVVYAHIAALLVGGGLAIATDRATLRVARAGPDERGRQLQLLHDAHRPVIISLFVLAISGILLAASDVETYAVSPRFWIKITLVALLLINGAALYHTEESIRKSDPTADHSDPLLRRLRLTSVLSLVLWLATALAGTVLRVAA